MEVSLAESLALGEQRVQRWLNRNSGVWFVLIQSGRSGYCHLCNYFCCLQAKGRLGPESSLSCPTLRAWGVHRNRAYPCYLLSASHSYAFMPLHLLFPFLGGKGNGWRPLKWHWTFSCLKNRGRKTLDPFLVLFPVPKREKADGGFTLLSLNI